MNLGIEYIIRSRIVESLFVPPLSLFLVNCANEKVIVTINQKKDSSSLIYWDLASCSRESGLPPMSEIPLENEGLEFREIQEKLGGHRLLAYKEIFVPDNYNNWRYPMPNFLYNNYSDSMLDSEPHRRRRKLWLWRAFTHTYCIYEECEDVSDMIRQQEDIMRLRYWKFWMLWKKHFLFLRPGELLFTILPN